MKKFKDVLEIMWDIVKAVFIILLMIIGIKLILLFIMPISIFSLFPYSPFDNYDWNPIATIIGSILTVVATAGAVYLTAREDRKARKVEFNEHLYRDKLVLLNDYIPFLESINNQFFNNKNNCKFENNHIVVKNDLDKLKNIKNILSYLKLLLPNSIYAKLYNNEIYNYEVLLNYLKNNCENAQLIEPQVFIQDLKSYIEDRNNRDEDEKEFLEVDFSNKQEIINNVRQEIEKEFRLG